MSELERIETLRDRLVLSSRRGHNFCRQRGLQNCRFQPFVLPPQFRKRFTFDHRAPGDGGHLLGEDGDVQAAGNGCGTSQQTVAAGFRDGATQSLAETLSVGVPQLAPVFGRQFFQHDSEGAADGDVGHLKRQRLRRFESTRWPRLWTCGGFSMSLGWHGVYLQNSGGEGAVQEERKRRALIEPTRSVLDRSVPAPPLPAGFAPRIAMVCLLDEWLPGNAQMFHSLAVERPRPWNGRGQTTD